MDDFRETLKKTSAGADAAINSSRGVVAANKKTIERGNSKIEAFAAALSESILIVLQVYNESLAIHDFTPQQIEFMESFLFRAAKTANFKPMPVGEMLGFMATDQGRVITGPSNWPK